MVSLFYLAIAISSLLAFASEAAIHNARGLPEGYTEVPMKWTLPIEAGGDNMTFSGNQQEVEAQIKAIKPDFAWRTPPSDIYALLSNKAQNSDYGPFFCDIGGDGRAPQPDVMAALLSLWGQPQCSYPPGPRTCSNVVCSHGMGIWLCNDGPSSLDDAGCHLTANTAHAVVDHCTDALDTVQGQAFNDLGPQLGMINALVGAANSC
ncbi:hypothetical protein F5Y15DRAFT_416171 [Xylariaceae sp. FL0016]|nr:hypothetical protein F5Y15DRAFT_416171 [Xylariaceae sp. FL0016]